MLERIAKLYHKIGAVLHPKKIDAHFTAEVQTGAKKKFYYCASVPLRFRVQGVN
jgi:hypothetical protein